MAASRSRNPRFTPEAIKANRVVVELLERLDENIGSLQVQLTSEDRQQIDQSMAQINVVGDRY